VVGEGCRAVYGVGAMHFFPVQMFKCRILEDISLRISIRRCFLQPHGRAPVCGTRVNFLQPNGRVAPHPRRILRCDSLTTHPPTPPRQVEWCCGVLQETAAAQAAHGACPPALLHAALEALRRLQEVYVNLPLLEATAASQTVAAVARGPDKQLAQVAGTVVQQWVGALLSHVDVLTEPPPAPPPIVFKEVRWRGEHAGRKGTTPDPRPAFPAGWPTRGVITPRTEGGGGHGSREPVRSSHCVARGCTHAHTAAESTS
jgi:hypothetical protein